MQPTVFEPMDMKTAETLLKEVKKILDELGLSFFLRHGTCLGAVRDKTLIPWDDDLDVGSVIGLHGLTEEKVVHAADVFRANGFDTEVVYSDLHISVDMKKSGTQIDWTCYRIIGDSIYQWPVVKIPVGLHIELKEIDFLGDRFYVPNPPEEYLRLKYGPEWMIPKRAGGFERDVLNLIPEGSLSGSSDGIMAALKRFLPKRHTGSLQILDHDGRPVEGAYVGIAATTVLSGLERSRTGKDGITRFTLPGEAHYVLVIRYGDHEEVLYLETLAPGVDYVYRPDPGTTSGRYNVLSPR